MWRLSEGGASLQSLRDVLPPTLSKLSRTVNRRVFIWGLALWLGFLYVGFNWSMKPYLTPLPDSRDLRAAVEGRFTLRLAKLDNSSLGVHSKRLAEEIIAPAPPFDYADWMWREARNRACIFMFVYFLGGGIIHWIVGQIHRDKLWLG